MDDSRLEYDIWPSYSIGSDGVSICNMEAKGTIMNVGYRVTKSEKVGWCLWSTELTPRYKVKLGDPYKEGTWVKIAWTMDLNPLLHLMHILMDVPPIKNNGSDNVKENDIDKLT
jgi:hypothetical protein